MYVEAGADLNFVHEQQGSILHAAVLQGSLDTVKYLCSASTLLQCQDEVVDGDGDTALHVACSLGHVDIIQ